MDIIIRNVKEEDIPDVVDIQVDGWRTAYKGIIEESYLNSMNKEERIELRKNDYNQGPFIVAEANNEIVGFCRFFDDVISPDGEGHDCELMAIYVKPTLKHQGIGKAMFDYVKKDLSGKGKCKMILWCLKDNYPSRKFYEKMGGINIREHSIELGEKLYKEVGFSFKL